MSFTVHNAEFLAWAKAEAQNGGKYHAVFCDPPYGIAFMGKGWDDVGEPAAFQELVKQWGDALLPLLYSGALVLVFGGTRTWHRLAAGLENSGFELWDTLLWLHGQGFPKGQDISKLIDKKNNDDRQTVICEGKRGNNNTHSLGSYNLAYEITAPATEQSALWSRVQDATTQARMGALPRVSCASLRTHLRGPRHRLRLWGIEC